MRWPRFRGSVQQVADADIVFVGSRVIKSRGTIIEGIGGVDVWLAPGVDSATILLLRETR